MSDDEKKKNVDDISGDRLIQAAKKKGRGMQRTGWSSLDTRLMRNRITSPHVPCAGVNPI